MLQAHVERIRISRKVVGTQRDNFERETDLRAAAATLDAVRDRNPGPDVPPSAPHGECRHPG